MKRVMAGVLVAGLAGWLLACSSEDSPAPAGSAGAAAGSAGAAGAAGAGEGGSAGAAGSVDDAGTTDGGEDAAAEGGTRLVATIDTAKGTIVVELEPEKAPITTENFKKYADDKFYDGLIFHRVIKDFMIQGGGLDENMSVQSTTYEPIVNEAKTSGLLNVAGTIAMARTSAPDSATSQFFINTVDNGFLDPSGSSAGYAVFGHVVEGMDVVHAIESVATGKKGMYDDVPLEPVLINSVKVEQK